MGWSAEICHQELFWLIWRAFSLPRNIGDALSLLPEVDEASFLSAVEGMLECNLLEVQSPRLGYDTLLDSAILQGQIQSLSYHLSSSRPDWVNYSDAQDIKKRDHDDMDAYVREEQPPSNYKLAANSRPTYDLASILPVDTFGDLAGAEAVFGWRASSAQNRLSLDALNFILNLTFAQTDTVEMYATGAHIRKAVPSGGARHPIEAYIGISDEVDGVEKGIYHYNVKFHRLDSIQAKEGDVEKFIRSATPLMHCRLKPVRAAIVHSCIFGRSMFRYRESRSYRVMNFDLGHIHANEVIASKLIGLDCNECYSVPEAIIESILRIDPLRESVMSSFMIY